MLEPQDRRMLLDLLRPPPGCELDFAIGTTYSLDLLAMLTAPLGFTLHGLEGTAAEVLESGDALLLLQTLRKYANRIGLFCQRKEEGYMPAPHIVCPAVLLKLLISVLADGL